MVVIPCRLSPRVRLTQHCDDSRLFRRQLGNQQTPTRDQIANALTHSEGKIRHDSSIKALFPVA